MINKGSNVPETGQISKRGCVILLDAIDNSKQQSNSSRKKKKKIKRKLLPSRVGKG